MFADDTNLFFRESSYEKVFQVANEELKSIDNWLTARAVAAAPQTPQLGGAHTAKRGPKLS